jgi:sec-independent protein translocase protein TatB
VFNVGLGEIAAILVLGLLIFGPDRLPRAVQTVAGGIRRLRTAADDATRSLQDAAGLDGDETRQALSEFADLHPRRIAGSVLEGGTRDRAGKAAERPESGGRPAPAPAVDFDPDAP